MRILLDTNIHISYLLLPQARNHPTTIIEAALAGAYTLLIASESLTEMARRIATKPYLNQRISADDLATLTETLHLVGEILPPIDIELPAISRDRKDDYLLAHAVAGEADFLVTGDHDLLTLSEVATVLIISPADLVARLSAP